MATISGGDKLANALAVITRNVEQPATLRVGFLAGATYPSTKGAHLSQKKLASTLAGKRTKVQTSGAGATPVAMIAAIQEFGAPGRGIPPRPFFRNMVKNKSGEWPHAIAGVLKRNGYDAAKSLAIVGEAVAGQLRESIIQTNSPPLAASTIARKGFSKPLIDTGHMINSVDYEVV
jgi:hypothetical protein